VAWRTRKDERMTKNAPVSLALVRNTVRYYWKQRRYRALLRATWLTVARRCGMELCQFCGGRYLPNESTFRPFCWRAPTSLWAELIDASGAGAGLCCPGCFDRKADEAGYRLMWTPLVWGDAIYERIDDVFESA
jgi:hypothetical protein